MSPYFAHEIQKKNLFTNRFHMRHNICDRKKIRIFHQAYMT